MTLLDDALAYGRRGWSVIPIGKEKRPVLRSWKQYQQRAANAAELVDLFAPSNVYGLAVVLGSVSGGLFNRDFDEMPPYTSWAARYPVHARGLPTVGTARGRHVYFASQNEIRTIKTGDGELRGEGGYCILPPSLHPSGCLYEWIVPLPTSHIPFVDPFAIGLCNCTERTEGTEVTKETEFTEDNRSGLVEESVLKRIRSIDDAVNAALPNAKNQNHHHLFTLARALLDYRDTLRAAHSDPALSLPETVTQEAFGKWYTSSKRFLRAEKSRDDYLFEFLDALANARFPLGAQEVLMRAFKKAATTTPKIAEQFESPEVKVLVSLCRELQRIHGSEPFFLSARTVANLFHHATHTTAALWLRGLVHSKILSVVTKGGPQSMKATRFKYLHPLDGE